MKDSLGDRMKHQYENRVRYMLPRRTHTIVRMDGKAFHTYTRGRKRPWDQGLHDNLVIAAFNVIKQAQGAVAGFVQSDEASILLTDFASNQTEAWFDANLQKIVSVSASVMTAVFNSLDKPNQEHGLAYFDSRAFTIPDPVEVHNYFVWRQKDIERNSLSMLAQHHYSHKQLHGQGRVELHDMLHKVGINWDDQPDEFKRGTLIFRDPADPTLWTTEAAPIFTQQPVIATMLGVRIDMEDKTLREEAS